MMVEKGNSVPDGRAPVLGLSGGEAVISGVWCVCWRCGGENIIVLVMQVSYVVGV